MSKVAPIASSLPWHRVKLIFMALKAFLLSNKINGVDTIVAKIQHSAAMLAKTINSGRFSFVLSISPAPTKMAAPPVINTVLMMR